ncbi:MAG: hypothetical protein JST39_00450, partial [Bacteroidetes bacterium]|nr:hypothetical protein [Bacteroidota bacterium]
VSNGCDYEFGIAWPEAADLLVVKFSLRSDGYHELGIADAAGRNLLSGEQADAGISELHVLIGVVWDTLAGFLERHPSAVVRIKADAGQCRKLIRMGIRLLWEDFCPRVEVIGWFWNRWEIFHRRIPYESYLFRCRQARIPYRRQVTLNEPPGLPDRPRPFWPLREQE